MDNFRLTYGDWLDRPFFNQTIHTNNFYLEMLVSLGILGALPFFLWLGSLLVNILRTLRRPDKSMWQVAIAAGLLAFVIHGFLDFFLLFNSTGLLFWLLVGLWIGEEQRHAHRV
jgi:O-antigen ligase